MAADVGTLARLPKIVGMPPPEAGTARGLARQRDDLVE